MLFEFNMLKPILLNVTVATLFVSVNFILILFKFEHVLLNFCLITTSICTIYLGCSDKWHIPVSCKVIKKWIKKCKDDSETCNWINANTKDCPKCNSAIEKNGGCNHMVCRRESCKHQFCWMCLGDWDKHGSRKFLKICHQESTCLNPL